MPFKKMKEDLELCAETFKDVKPQILILFWQVS